MASEDYIPCTGDDWYERRRTDAEGKFFRHVADQSPRRGPEGSTRQGIYCLTAAGKLLAFKNPQEAEYMREVLRAGLAAWKKLPESERRPGAVTVDEPGQRDLDYARPAPEGGLILNVFTRALDSTGEGNFADAVCKTGAGDEAARDHLWLTQKEWRSLVPKEPRVGDSFPVPRQILERIVRFHLVDNTRGEPNHWTPEEIRSASMSLMVESVSTDQVKLRLDGSVLLSTSKDLDKAARGFDANLLGYLAFDRKALACTRFDVIALGNHWGEGTYTGGARPGRTPLGIAFELTKGNVPANLVPPQGARHWKGYIGNERPEAGAAVQ
jgi:hypothetical protein